MKLITTTLLDELSEKAASSPRKRTNFNIHLTMDEPVHRMFNAIEPGHLYVKEYELNFTFFESFKGFHSVRAPSCKFQKRCLPYITFNKI